MTVSSRSAFAALLLAITAGCGSGGPTTASPQPVHSTPSGQPVIRPPSSPIPPKPVLEVGPVLEPSKLPALSARGLAVESEGQVVLVGLDGHVFGHFPGFKVDELITVPGPVLIHGPERESYILRPGARSLEPQPGLWIPLAGGATLVGRGTGKAEPRSWSIERDGKVLMKVGNQAWSISQGRELVTLQRFPPAGVSSRALDVRTEALTSLPPECAVMARRHDDLFLLCDRKFATADEADDMRSIEVLHGSSMKPERIAGGLPGGGLGFWRQAFLSPDGQTILAQWSGECEVQETFVVPASGGKPQPVAQAAGNATAESFALGWTPDGQALVFLPFAACGAGADVPGVYARDRDGTLSLVYQTSEFASVKLWQ
jgi:hypothetical protein